MRIDFSEPECSNCFHCRTLSILNTQESEPSNVIASSVNSMPVNSEPVQALEHASATVGSTSALTSSPVQALDHDSAAVGSTSTSSPIHALGYESVAVGSTSTSSPVQALSHDSAAVGSTSTSSPVQALGHDDSAATGSISTFSFGSQTPSAPPVITSVCSEPVQTLASTSLRSDVFGSPFQATSGSGASATSTSSTSSPIQTSSPNRFLFAPIQRSMQAPVQATSGFGASATSTSSISSLFQSSSPNRFEFSPAVTSVGSAPTQAFGPNGFGFGAFSDPTHPRLGSMQAPVQASSGFGASATPTSSTSSPVHSFSPFGFAPAVTSVSSAPTQASGQTTFGFGSSPNSFGFAPAVALVSSAPTQAFGQTTFGFGSSPNRVEFAPAVTSVSSAPTQAFGPNTCGFNAFATQPRLGSMQAPAQATSGFGAFSGTTPPIFGSMQAPVQATFGSGAFGTSTSSGFLPFGSIPAPPTIGSSLFGPMPNVPFTGVNRFNWGSRYPRYTPTPDGETGSMYTSISASRPKSHPPKSHEELRWEDYKQGYKGSRTATFFGYPPMASPSIFASPSVPDHPQRTTFGTTQESFTGPVSCFPQHNPAFTGFGSQFPNSSSSFFTTFPPINSSVQRPHETADVSSPASGCTACGTMTSTFASGYSTFNGATLTPPSAATTSLPGLLYPMYGSVPMMFATTPAAQVTTPALQAYPVNDYILLPFAAMNLQ